MSGVGLKLTDQTFDEEINGSEEAVLVDFYADWCGPCKAVAPILDEIAVEQAGKLKVAKVNVDDNVDLSQRFSVLSIPTLNLFKGGEVKVRLQGAKGKGQLLQELQPYL